MRYLAIVLILFFLGCNDSGNNSSYESSVEPPAPSTTEVENTPPSSPKI